MNSERMTPAYIHDRMMRVAEEWASLDGDARLLEETQKTLLAQLSLREIERGESVAKSESVARASKEYQMHVAAMVDARTEANKAKARLEAARAWFDAWRTQESTKRAEMHMAGAA